MAVPDESQPSSAALSLRRQAYREEVQRIVREGAEHPTCELVREMRLQSPEQKVDFAKLLQGLGNALIATERFVVIGADQSAKKFAAVTNLDDFDAARISQMLSKYLDTLPLFESFSFEADGGEPFVVIVIAPRQPKPIVAKTDIQADDGRFLLRKGDIWVKENTGLRRAARVDLDSMYEEDSEARARRWFDRLSTQLLSSQRLANLVGVPIPQADLIYGDAQTFRLYVQTLIAGNHQRQFLMLLDLLRDLAVDGWNKVEGYSRRPAENVTEYIRVVNDHAKDYFLPATKTLVELGLLLIKHSADSAWLVLVAQLLAEIFDSSGKLMKLSVADVIERDVFVSFGRYLPALEALIGIRALALYALRRGRYDVLSFVLKRYVRSLVPPRRLELPFVFWPFPGGIKMPEGLILFCWRHRIESSWAEYFGSLEEYERLASQLEFILEFNSWLGISPEGTAWLAEHKKDTTFTYYADIWRANLNSVVGLAERIYDGLKSQDDFLAKITVEKILLDLRLKVAPQSPQLLLGAYLDYLIVNQGKAALRMGRFPHSVDWGEKIKPMLKDYRDRKEKGTLPPNLAFLPE